MHFVLVHGFNVKNAGATTVDQLASYIRDAGHTVDVDEGDYGYFNIWMIRLFRRGHRARVLYRLAKAFETADVIITHSNGANFTTKAMDMLDSEYNNTKIVIHISPALNRKTLIPQAIKAQLVLHTPKDWAVRLSSYIPWFPWGRMGAFGYKGEDNRNTNLEDSLVKSHSAWFTKLRKAITWSYCNRFVKEHYS